MSVSIFSVVLSVIFALVKPFIGFGNDRVDLVYGDSDADAESHRNSEYTVVDLEGMRPERLVYLLGEGETLLNARFGAFGRKILSIELSQIMKYRREI